MDEGSSEGVNDGNLNISATKGTVKPLHYIALNITMKHNYNRNRRVETRLAQHVSKYSLMRRAGGVHPYPGHSIIQVNKGRSFSKNRQRFSNLYTGIYFLIFISSFLKIGTKEQNVG